MGYINCFNLLGQPEVFIPTAALLALVLLVWVQLHVHGKEKEEERDVNWFCGVAWAYLAILSALTAVALFICEISTCARGFLILAFFMTGINIIIVFVLNIANIARLRFEDFPSKKPPAKSLLGECGKNKLCGLFWLATLAGLILISFSLVGVQCCCFSRLIIGMIGLKLILKTVVVVAVIAVLERKKKNDC